MELEAAGHWKLVKERKVPYYERDDLPTECTAFVYKVLKHWIANLSELRFQKSELGLSLFPSISKNLSSGLLFLLSGSYETHHKS